MDNWDLGQQIKNDAFPGANVALRSLHAAFIITKGDIYCNHADYRQNRSEIILVANNVNFGNYYKVGRSPLDVNGVFCQCI